MNKKIVSALLCGTMVLATATPALAGEADGQKIALVGKSAGNAFFEIAAASFKETVEAEGGEVEVVYPEAATADAQIKVLDNLISQDFDAICISANDVNLFRQNWKRQWMKESRFHPLILLLTQTAVRYS